jgi:hypothetical protein
MAKGVPKEAALLLGVVALLWDLRQADQHKRTCPRCVGRDYLAIALDVAHLAQV